MEMSLTGEDIENFTRKRGSISKGDKIYSRRYYNKLIPKQQLVSRKLLIVL